MRTQGHQKAKRSARSTIFSQQIQVGRLQVFSVNPPLKLLSCPLVTASNNLSHKICYENVVDISFFKLMFYFTNYIYEAIKLYLH